MKALLLSLILVTIIGCGGGVPVVPQPPVVGEVGINITDGQVIESDGNYNSTPSVIQVAAYLSEGGRPRQQQSGDNAPEPGPWKNLGT